MATADLTPAVLLEHLRELTGAESWEKLARELDVDSRLLSRWQAGEVLPGWENALMLLHRAGYLVDGDAAVTSAQLRQAQELAGRLEQVARDLQHLLE